MQQGLSVFPTTQVGFGSRPPQCRAPARPPYPPVPCRPGWIPADLGQAKSAGNRSGLAGHMA